MTNPETLQAIYQEVAKQAEALARLAQTSEADDDMAGAIKLLGNAMERIAMARVMAQCDAQDPTRDGEVLARCLTPDPLARATVAALDATEKALEEGS